MRRRPPHTEFVTLSASLHPGQARKLLTLALGVSVTALLVVSNAIVLAADNCNGATSRQRHFGIASALRSFECQRA